MMSKDHVPPCSTAASQSCNFLQLSGLTCSVEMLSTLTTSSQTSTQYPTASAMSLNSERMLDYSMDLWHQPKLSKPTVTGSLPGTAWSMLPSLCSDTESRSSSPMGSTFRDTLHLCHPSFTAGSSTTTELSGSEQLSDETLSSGIFPSSWTCRSSGSAIHQDLPLASLQNPLARKGPKGRQSTAC